MSKVSDEKPLTTFDVIGSRTLIMADFFEPQIRSDFYEDVSQWWFESPAHLADAMEECQPLAWAVQSIYTKVRDEIRSDLEKSVHSPDVVNERSAALTARLNLMPEEPEDGVNTWLLSLTTSEFQHRIVPDIDAWFDSPPNWNWEDDHLPSGATPQGAALEYFQNMDSEVLDTLGVDIIEGDRPGSTYYAEELAVDIEAANKAAADAGIPVRFKRSNL